MSVLQLLKKAIGPYLLLCAGRQPMNRFQCYIMLKASRGGGGGLVAGPRPQTSLLSGMVAVNEFLESLKVVNSLTKMFGVLGCSLPVSRILFEGTQLRL